MTTKIKAVDDAGAVVHVFDSIRAAGRAGYTISRVHKAIYSGQRHRGLKWYLSGKLDALAMFMGAAFDFSANDWTHEHDIYSAFRAALSPDEDLGSDYWDYFDFQRALWRIVSPRPYTKAGRVRGGWKGEHPGDTPQSVHPAATTAADARDAAGRSEPPESC